MVKQRLQAFIKQSGDSFSLPSRSSSRARISVRESEMDILFLFLIACPLLALAVYVSTQETAPGKKDRSE